MVSRQPGGKFFNSIHFWSVQLFFAFMMLHLTAKYFIGAFRDGRWKTWMMGASPSGPSIFSGFTGYLSAANWSAQWHAVEAKDAMNAMGIGGFFFTTNYQPDADSPRGRASHLHRRPRGDPHTPHQARRAGEALSREGGGAKMSRRSDEYLRGVPMKPYDLVREGLIAFGFVAALVVVLAIVFKSPDAPTVRGEDVAKNHPLDYLKTAADLLSGESALESYGPPYTEDKENIQRIFGPGPAAILGVTLPIDAEQDLVIAPFERVAVLNKDVAAALAAWKAAARSGRRPGPRPTPTRWTRREEANGLVKVPAGDYGPVAVMMTGMLDLGRAGLLEGALTSGEGLPYTPRQYEGHAVLPGGRGPERRRRLRYAGYSVGYHARGR